MAIAGDGRFLTVPPSRHTLTNIHIIKCFMDVSIMQMAARSLLMHSRRTRFVNLDGMVFPQLWFNHQFAGCVNIEAFSKFFRPQRA